MEYKFKDVCDMEVPTVFPIRNTSTEANVRSDVQLCLKSFFYTWTIGNFSKCLQFDDPRFYSPEFTFENTVWRLRLHVLESYGEKKISIRLSRKEKAKADFYIKNNVSVFDEEGKLLSDVEMETNFQGDNTVSKEIPLMMGDLETLPLLNDKLIIHCGFLVLTSLSRDDISALLKKPYNTCDSKLEDESVPPLKSYDRSLKTFPDDITNRLSERSIYSYKEHLIILLLAFLFLQYYYVASEVAMKYVGMHNNNTSDEKHCVKGEKINELIIDSTIKLMNIAEVLNLTDVKIKSTEILVTYLGMYNNTASELLRAQGDRASTSKFLTSNIKGFNVSDIKLPMFGLGNNSQEALDKND